LAAAAVIPTSVQDHQAAIQPQAAAVRVAEAKAQIVDFMAAQEHRAKAVTAGMV
jgi:hypothetical protein